jgi:pimeloyl-ACP methyl ester carboxylesterase
VIMLRTALAIVLSIVVTALASCSSRAPERYDYFRVTVDGQETLGISAQNALVRGVVVFFHGMGGDEFAMTSDDAHKSMTSKLVDAGFAVVSSSAGGDAFGDPASQQNYLYLGGEAAQHYHTDNIFFLAESMGAVAAINLLTSLQTLRFRGLAAINPVLDLAEVAPQYKSTVAEKYQNQSMASVNPMDVSPDAIKDKKLKFYVSSDDSLVPADANALAFQKRFGLAADISIVKCFGRHGDPSCFQGDDIVKWFTSLERRG